MTDKDILHILKKNLSIQSTWILITLLDSKENELIPKEALWEKTNEKFLADSQSNGNTLDSNVKIISSRYVLDVHTSRLEGAGLIDFEQFGKVKFYKVTDFGKYFFNNIQ